MSQIKRQFAILFSLILLLMAVFPPSVHAADPLDRVWFFGDSTTAHLACRGGIPEHRVWSGVGNTVLFETVNRTRCVFLEEENESVTLAEAVARVKPPILVITLGVSGGAGLLGRERFTAIYREMLDSVRAASPETALLVQSILPLSDRSVAHYTRLTKEAVIEANGWIRALCEELDIPYIDTHARLVGENGYLPKIYQNDEYMHLTQAAYAVVLDSIRQTIAAQNLF